MTQHQQHKAQILEQIKRFTNSGRHCEAMGLYERHFGDGSQRAASAEHR